MGKPEELIKSIANGNRKAFHQLYEIFSSRVYNTAISYLHHEEDAEEVTQDVFVSVFRNAAKFKGKSAVSTWIYRITVNTCLNHLRKKKRTFNFEPENLILETPDFEHPGVLLENKENAALLFKVINTLPNNQRTVFILSYVEGLPKKEVASIMEISLKATESLLQRAKKNLRQKLEKLYPHRRKKKK